ncbi:MAG: D-Ala-D-Ala carboxypeptidase family metallohydrolase, partial [Pseudomonadota bacterium]
SPASNRRAGGARNSRHTFCDAADIQVAGVSKWTLAKYLRTIPGRGGVGTYCHTKSVHIDTYKKRDWNWACRKRKRRRG